jgi:hypothetical protein
MQHPCHRCGAPVEDGTPFCRQCSAPQIKVVATEPPVPEEAFEAQAEFEAQPRRISPPARSQPIEWRSALPAILFVAVPAGLLSFRPNILFFLWTFAAGAMSVSSYRKRSQTPITPAMAARLGLLSGVVAFAVFLVVFLFAMNRPDFGPPLRDQMRDAIERSVASSADPNAKHAAEMLSSPDGLATLLTLVLGIFFLAFILFSVLGAVAGATVFAPKNRAP